MANSFEHELKSLPENVVYSVAANPSAKHESRLSALKELIARGSRKAAHTDLADLLLELEHGAEGTHKVLADSYHEHVDKLEASAAEAKAKAEEEAAKAEAAVDERVAKSVERGEADLQAETPAASVTTKSI